MIMGRSGSRYRAKPGGGYGIHRRSLPWFSGRQASSAFVALCMHPPGSHHILPARWQMA